MLHIEISAGFKLVRHFLKYNLTPSAKGTGLDAVELEIYKFLCYAAHGNKCWYVVSETESHDIKTK